MCDAAGQLASGPICLALGFSIGIGGVVCVAAIVGTGAWVGTTFGNMAGEYVGEIIYEGIQPLPRHATHYANIPFSEGQC